MAWPLSQDYNEAIQSPELAFSDADLRLCEAKCNAIGIPMPRSGNFADVYEMTAPSGKKWALKCFTRQVAGLRERYAAISAYLKQVNLPFMVDFTYLEQGVKVKGQWYPALKMQWVEGFTFNEFVKEHADQPQYLELLSQIWLRLARRLREAKMAHADLQHGNVLLVPGAKATSLGVRLIDYDGMFVPALADKKSGEVGHPAYQHPQRLRDSIYSVEVDRFPHLVIYTALRCLMVGGRYLWNKYDNGDNLLFRQQDLDDPANSALFAELRKLSDAEAGKLVTALAQAARQPLEQTPLLDQLVTDKAALTTRPKPAAGPLPEKESSAESVFAAATVGSDTGAAGSSYRRRATKKANPWLWPSVALAAVVVAGGAAFVLMSGKGARDKGPEVAAGAKTSTPEKKVPEPEKPPEPKVDPKLDPKVDPKLDPKNDPPPPPLPPDGDEALSLRGHTGLVKSVVFSSDGKQIISGSHDQTVKVWDAQTGQEQRTFKGHAAEVWSIAISPDGKRIAVCGGLGDSLPKVLDAQTGQVQRTLEGHTAPARCVAFSPDGKQIVSGADDRTVKVWDAQTGQVVRTLEGHAGAVRCVTFSADGKRLASCSHDQTVKIWDAQNGQLERTLQGHTAPVYSVAFGPDGKRLVSGSQDQTVKLWSAQTGEVERTFQGHTSSVECVAFSPGGDRIASGDNGRTLKLWSVPTGQEERSLAGHTHGVRSVAFSPDGKRLVSGSVDKTVKIWNLPEVIVPPPVPVAGGGPRLFEGLEGEVYAVAFSPDGRQVFAGVMGGSFRAWDTDSGKELRHTNIQTRAVRTMTYTTDGQYVLHVGTAQFVLLWSVAAGKVARQFDTPGTGNNTAALTGDGRQALIGGGDRIIRLFDVATGKESGRFLGHTGPVMGLGLSADGRIAVSVGSQELTIRVWDVPARKELRRLVGHQGTFIGSVALSSDGRRAVSTGGDKTMRVWDVATGKELHRWGMPDPWTQRLALSPNGRLVLSGHKDGLVQLWDVQTGKELRRLDGHQGRITCLAFSPDGRRALSGATDKTVRLWDLPGGPVAKGGGDVTAAFQLRNVKLQGGPYRVGDQARFSYELTNISGAEVAIPVDKANPTGKPMVGVLQRWIEKLDGDPTIPSMGPKIARSGRKYAVGGQQMMSPPVVPKDHSFKGTGILPTNGYLPGRYRYVVEYRKLNGEVLQTESVDFDLQPAGK